MSKKILIAVLIFIVGVVIFFWFISGDNEESLTPQSAIDFVSLFSRPFAVPNQVPGNTIDGIILNVQESVWVVIEADRTWDDPEKEAIYEIIGIKFVKLGETVDKINLTENNIDGGYVAAVFSDDGDGVFDRKKDTILKDSSGNPLAVIFIVDSSIGEGAIGKTYEY